MTSSPEKARDCIAWPPQRIVFSLRRPWATSTPEDWSLSSFSLIAAGRTPLCH